MMELCIPKLLIICYKHLIHKLQGIALGPKTDTIILFSANAIKSLPMGTALADIITCTDRAVKSDYVRVNALFAKQTNKFRSTHITSDDIILFGFSTFIFMTVIY